MNVMTSGIDFFGEGMSTREPCGCGCYEADYAAAFSKAQGLPGPGCSCLCGCTGELRFEFGPDEFTLGDMYKI